MTTSLKEWSVYASDDGAPLSEADKAYFRARTRRHVHGVVLEKFIDLSDDDRLSRSMLAHRLNVHRAQITRWLSSPGNWTLDTLSDLLLAMSCQAKVFADKIGDQQIGNYAHPASTTRQTSAMRDPYGSSSDERTTVTYANPKKLSQMTQASTSEAA